MKPLAIAIIALSVAVFAQTKDTYPRTLSSFTVATLPTPAANSIAIVTDGTTASDCTVGGGSTRSLCAYSGSGWVSIGGSSGGGDATYPSILDLKEILSNGANSVWWVGNPSQSADTCYVLPTAVGTSAQVLSDSGTTTTIDPDGAGPLASRTCRILNWQTVSTSSNPSTVKSAISATTTNNVNTFESLASISLPAMAVGSTWTLDYTLSNTGAGNVSWDVEPRVGATAIFSERDPSGGTDDYSTMNMTCRVVTSSNTVCTAMYIRWAGSQGAADWNTSGLAIVTTSIDFTSAQTLQLWVQQRAVTTDDVFLVYRVVVNAAL